MTQVNECPSISVIIPSYNQGEFIEQTILSVLQQNYPNLEIFVLDGGSNDGTIDVLKKYSQHLTYWHSRKDKGQADAINQGIQMSSGEIVCWLNSDDMYLPGVLLEVGQKFIDRTDTNYLVYGDLIFQYEEEKPRQARQYQYGAPFDPFRLTYYDYIGQPSSFWTRKLWEQVGELNLEYHYVLDWDWFIRASKIIEFEYIPKFFSIYRIHATHKSHNGGTTRKKEVLEIVQKYSSDYWSNLYKEVERSYDEIKRKRRILRRLQIPKSDQVLPFLLPDLTQKLNHPEDLIFALNMYS